MKKNKTLWAWWQSLSSNANRKGADEFDICVDRHLEGKTKSADWWRAYLRDFIECAKEAESADYSELVEILPALIVADTDWLDDLIDQIESIVQLEPSDDAVLDKLAMDETLTELASKIVAERFLNLDAYSLYRNQVQSLGRAPSHNQNISFATELQRNRRKILLLLSEHQAAIELTVNKYRKIRAGLIPPAAITRICHGMYTLDPRMTCDVDAANGDFCEASDEGDSDYLDVDDLLEKDERRINDLLASFGSLFDLYEDLMKIESRNGTQDAIRLSARSALEKRFLDFDFCYDAERLGERADVDHEAGRVQALQGRRLAVVGEIKRGLSSLRFAPPDTRPV